VVATAPGSLGIDLEVLTPFLAAVGPLAIVDLETTGLMNDSSAEILEFGALLLEPGRDDVTVVESLVSPRGEIPAAIRRLTGIEPEVVAGAPRIDHIAKPIEMALAGRTLIAHNAEFERSFLTRFVSTAFADHRYLDTQDLLALTHPDASDLRLATFARVLLERDERHRAVSDAVDALLVMCAVAQGSRAGERRYAVARSALERFDTRSSWVALLAGDPLAAIDPPAEFARIDPSAETPVPFDEEAILAVLRDGERGARYFPGYRVREQQVELARQFVRVLDGGGRLILEVGTGVGKSLAYLAAAIPYAMERAAGGVRDPVLISTRTKLLQDQLLEKDIPAAAAMFGYPDLRALSIKGRANYVCARRIAAVYAEGREPQMFDRDRLAYAALASCAGIRRHGEIGKLPAGILYRFRPLRDLVRRSVAARAEQCTREQCATERSCPFGKRRAALARAQLVVANHDLLLRWPPDYPNFVDAIVDEAHDLGGVADEVYAIEVRPPEVLERLGDLFGSPSDGRRGGGLLGPAGLDEPEADAREWQRGVARDLQALGESLANRASEFGEVQLPLYAERLFPEAAERAQLASERIGAAADAADDLAASRGKDDEVLEIIERFTGELRGAASALAMAFSASDSEAVAAFERLEPPFDRWRLAVRAVAPADAFHERFADKLETLACVSASLFVGDDSFASLGELELERPGAGPLTRCTVESPFPYDTHMRVAAFDSRGDLVDDTVDVLERLARLLGGRTLGLFTSLRRMNDVCDRLTERLRGDGFDVLMPRRASDDPTALVERFCRAEGGSVLLGARTFWQGLDIPGDALQAVVIEKLPFEVPNELRRRREQRVRSAGEDSFGRYTLGKMLLNLKQMSGRLIRSEDDRGLVVIVEGRPDRPYFDRLREAFPPDCGVTVATREDLPELLAEVGIAPS
jgi:ATP-dependent DNA helicase DinG